MRGRVDYNYFRTYDPSTGRYLESDPIGLNGGINTFVYVENDPLNYIDPKGLNRGVATPPSWPDDLKQDKEYRQRMAREIRDYRNGVNANPVCLANCYAERQAACVPARVAGGMCGVTVAGVASVWTGGTAFPFFARVGVAVGSTAGHAYCAMAVFQQSRVDKCTAPPSLGIR